MAMTKKRISGILLAVALFVGVFAATPAFAATTTTAKGVTIDWTNETIQFNDANLTVTLGGKDFHALSTAQKLEDDAHVSLIPDAGAADAKMTIHDGRETADKDEVVTIPARPAAPKYLSSANPGWKTTTTSITILSPIAGQEYAIDGAWLGTAAFSNLFPADSYEISARVAAVAGKSFASLPGAETTISADDFTSYFVDGASGKIGLKTGFALYSDAAMTPANKLGEGPSYFDITEYYGKNVYVKNTAKGTYEVVSLVQPAAPAAPKFTVTNDSIKLYAATTEEALLKAFMAKYEVAVLSNNYTPAELASADYYMWDNGDYATGVGAGTTMTFAIRAFGTSTTLPSAPVIVKVTTLRDAPVMQPGVNYRIDFAAEKIFFGSDVTPLQANTKADFTGTDIKSGDSITSVIDAVKAADRVVYFRYPETATLAASASVAIPELAHRDTTAPAAPVVSSTEETITITNKYAPGVEFSIDGSNWTTKTVFTAKDNKVEDGKEYTVYARYAGTETAFASEPAKTVTKTPAKKVVTFKSGATVVATSKFVNGAALVYPAAPKKTGYRFAGWDVAAGTAVNADTTVNAQWKVIRGLKTIRKSAGRMTPAFKISQKTYKVVLSKSTSKVKLVAKRRSTAQVVKTYYKGKVYKTYYKTVKLSRGASTTVKFYVKAADGKTTTYYVKVVRK